MSSYSTGVSLGPRYTGQSIGYRLLTLGGGVVAAFTTAGVAETSVPGDYTVTGGIPLPPGFVGRIVWGTAGTDLAEEVFSAVAYAPSPYDSFASLGPAYSGRAVGYRLVDLSGSTAAAFSAAGVVEANIPGDYIPTAGVVLPDGFQGRIVWGTAGLDLAEEWVNATPVPASPGSGASPYRDLQILDLVRQAVDATNEFQEVTLGGIADTKAETSETLKLADLDIRGTATKTMWSDPDAVPQERTVRFTLTIHVRDPDPVTRLHELDRLHSVASNAVNGKSFGGQTYVGATGLGDSTFEPPAGSEQRLRVAGSFTYEVSDWDQFNTSK
jgi:hypothetical protein